MIPEQAQKHIRRNHVFFLFISLCGETMHLVHLSDPDRLRLNILCFSFF